MTISHILQPRVWGHNWGWNQSLSFNLAYGKAVSDWRQLFQTCSGCHHQIKKWCVLCLFLPQANDKFSSIFPFSDFENFLIGWFSWKYFEGSHRTCDHSIMSRLWQPVDQHNSYAFPSNSRGRRGLRENCPHGWGCSLVSGGCDVARQSSLRSNWVLGHQDQGPTGEEGVRIPADVQECVSHEPQ